MTEPTLPTIRLITVAHSAAAFADDLRKHPTPAERHARGVLLALVAAIHNGSLEGLVATIKPWMRREVARIDALTDAASHDRLSAAVGEMGMVGADLDELVQLDLPDSYSGIG